MESTLKNQALLSETYLEQRRRIKLEKSRAEKARAKERALSANGTP